MRARSHILTHMNFTLGPALYAVRSQRSLDQQNADINKNSLYKN